MAIAINFVMDQGTLFEAFATIENEDGSLFDLTGLTPYCQMRKSYYTSSGYDITASVDGDPTLGVVKLSMLPADSSAVKAGRYVYDVEVHNAGGDYVKRVLQGVITVYPQVTRTP
jgi:hypothetical protein